MDEILAELIKSLQWPTVCDLRSKPEKPLRRPSPYWIQKKVEEKFKGQGPNGRKVGGIESKWKKIESIVDMHLVLNLENFGYRRSMISWRGGMIRLKEIMASLRKLDFIESAHSSLLLGTNGNMEPRLITEIFHRGKSDLDRKLARMEKMLEGFSRISIFEGTPLFPEYDQKARKRLMNGSHEPRARIKKLLKKLIEEPLIKLPSLASETGFSRSETKRYFYDLVHGGVVLFEPAINAMALSDFTLSFITITGNPENVNNTYRTMMESSSIGSRVLFTKSYYNGMRALLCWSSSYYDVMDLFSEASSLNTDANIGLAWQFRTIPVKTVKYPFLEE